MVAKRARSGMPRAISSGLAREARIRMGRFQSGRVDGCDFALVAGERPDSRHGAQTGLAMDVGASMGEKYRSEVVMGVLGADRPFSSRSKLLIRVAAAGRRSRPAQQLGVALF